MTEARSLSNRASRRGRQAVEEQPKQETTSIHAVATAAKLVASFTKKHTTGQHYGEESDEDEASERSTWKPSSAPRRDPQKRFGRRGSETSETSRHVDSFAKWGGTRILKYPVECVVPESPTLALTAQPFKEWQTRVEQANKTEGCETASEPQLLWYGCELQRVCAQALLESAGQVIRLQSHLAVDRGHWEAGGRLWEQLLESSRQFSAVSYVVEKVSNAIVSQDEDGAGEHDREHAKGSGKHASRAPADRLLLLRARCFRRSEALPQLQASVQPQTAHEALADIQMQISRLQASGTPLSVLLRRIRAAELPRMLKDEALVGQLFLVVPCLELAVVRLKHLTTFAIRIQEDARLLRIPATESGPQEGAGLVKQEVSHEAEQVVEVGNLLQASPDEENGVGVEPAQASADTERDDAQQQNPDSQQDDANPEEAGSPSGSPSKASSKLQKSLRKVKTKNLSAKNKAKK